MRFLKIFLGFAPFVGTIMAEMEVRQTQTSISDVDFSHENRMLEGTKRRKPQKDSRRPPPAYRKRKPQQYYNQPDFVECKIAPAQPEDRRYNTSRLQFTTYNVEFMFIQGIAQLKCPGPDCKWKTKDMAKSHIRQVAQNIHQMNSDIIQLTEVEDCTSLQLLVKELAALGDASYRPYLVRGTDSFTGQNVAIITRIDPMIDIQRTDERFEGSIPGSQCEGIGKAGLSKNLYTTFFVPGLDQPLTLVAAHLYARPDDMKRCAKREAQALIMSNVAKSAISNGHHVIMSGDINDWSRRYPDRNQNQPITKVLDILEGTEFQQIDQLVPPSERYSHWWDRTGSCQYNFKDVSALDHILVSNQLFSNVEQAIYHHELYQADCDSLNPDHYPISIVLHT